MSASDLVEFLESRTFLSTTQFQSPIDFATGKTPDQIASGDFNRDGNIDLVVSERDANKIGLLLGNGKGSFASIKEFNVGHTPVWMAVGDFNRDAKLDVAVANFSAQSNSVSILLGDGAGGFTSQTQTPVGAIPNGLAAADFNLDGKLDLVTADPVGKSFRLLQGNGDGTFQPAWQFFTESAPTSVIVADLNNDGHDDVITNSANGIAEVFPGQGNDNFFNVNLKSTTPTLPSGGATAIADFDGDRLLDMIVIGGGQRALLYGNGAGAFSPPAVAGFLKINPTSLTTADIDHDGRVDVIFGDNPAPFDPNGVGILLGKDNPLLPYTFARSFTAGANKHGGTVIADFNKDGAPDVAVTNSTSLKSVSVLINGTGSTIMGSVYNDLRSDGQRNGDDAGIAGRVVYIDNDGDHQLTQGDAAVTTDAQGNFIFDELVGTGKIHIRELTPAGSRVSQPKVDDSPLDLGYDVFITPDQIYRHIDFGETTKVFIDGTVFNDVNGDGVAQQGDTPIPNVTINVVSNGQIIATRKTDSRGLYVFNNLPAGTGELRVVVPAGFTPSSPATGKYVGSVSSGEVLVGKGFALHPTAPAPTVFAKSPTILSGKIDDLKFFDEV